MQALQSSIPAPPGNFKLRDDHMSGSSLRGTVYQQIVCLYIFHHTFPSSNVYSLVGLKELLFWYGWHLTRIMYLWFIFCRNARVCSIRARRKSFCSFLKTFCWKFYWHKYTSKFNLTAPRSFFSLSSFRSKGSDSKPR